MLAAGRKRVWGKLESVDDGGDRGVSHQSTARLSRDCHVQPNVAPAIERDIQLVRVRRGVPK